MTACTFFFAFILFLLISTICYFLGCYSLLLGGKIYNIIVNSVKWNYESITIGNLLDFTLAPGIFILFLVIIGIAFLCTSILIFLGLIVVGLIKKTYEKLKNNYKFSNIRNIRIG